MNDDEQLILEEQIIGRTRRTFQLVNYCIANIAAYRVNWITIDNKRTLRIDLDFWVRANGTFFDMTVIEWCKLFADKNGKHHWSKTFPNHQEWTHKLLQHLEMSEEDYEVELAKIKDYRDKYVAHLDNPKSMNYPLTEFMLVSASHLYDSIKNSEQTKTHVGTIYDSANAYYLRMMNDYNKEIEVRLNQQH